MATQPENETFPGAPDDLMWPIPIVARLAWAAIWLVFLGYPISDILGTGYSPAKAVIAWVCLVAFAGMYLVAMWLCLSLVPRVAAGVQLLPLAAVFVMGITMALVFRGQWTGLLVYCGVTAGWTLRWRFLV